MERLNQDLREQAMEVYSVTTTLQAMMSEHSEWVGGAMAAQCKFRALRVLCMGMSFNAFMGVLSTMNAIDLEAVHQDPVVASHLRANGVTAYGLPLMGFFASDGRYDRIFLIPSTSDSNGIFSEILHAWSMLAGGGVLLTVAPDFSSNTAALAVRQIVDRPRIFLPPGVWPYFQGFFLKIVRPM